MGLRTSASSGPQWESRCVTSFLTFEELSKWDEVITHRKATNGETITSLSHWAYFDYVHLKEQKKLEFLKECISWEKFGYKGRGADESTVWIGTKGAHTPCHIDTYGCNLVTQVLGAKKWTLFPPQQSECLYPTRIPYEESSIYSQIDFKNVDINRFPKIQNSTPFVVTLNPGDVLFVPKHWWHFVETEQFSISVNSWIELPSDTKDQLKEALVLQQIGSVCQAVSSADKLTKILNPNMLYIVTLTSEELFAIVSQRIAALKNKHHSSTGFDHTMEPSETSGSKPDLSLSLPYTVLKSIPFQDFLLTSQLRGSLDGGNLASHHPPSTPEESETVEELLIRSLSDQRVIDVATDVLMENLRTLHNRVL
ncbi:hypothetical protein HAZT_HAZT010888 [Hyalella azteca]|nr:hypothetical protein HAZT_HAZT010888 [Hyalella azteca]